MTPDDLAQRRLLSAERCENLIQALQLMSAVLRGTPAGGNEVREEVARCLSEGLSQDKLEAAFDRVDAVWAAWNRPDLSSRNRESIERHARVVVLAAAEQAANFIRLSRSARALARRRMGRVLGPDEDALLQERANETEAAELLDGTPHLQRTLCGDLEVGRDDGVTVDTAADAELPAVPELLRWLIAHNGYPDLASRLTDEHAERLVRAWPKSAGRPRGGEPSSWAVIRSVLAELDLGESENARKDWEAFRRESGFARTSRGAVPHG
jgi:hypothetical protein